MLFYEKLGRTLYFTYLIIILISAIIPPSNIPSSIDDKIVHAVGFMGVALLYAWAYKKEKWWKNIIYGLAFGIFIEIIQYFIPYRSFELFDIIADGVGLILGVLLVEIMRKVERR